MINQNQQAMSLPIDRKMLLSIREAAEYSNIGINKIDEMLKQPNCPFVLYSISFIIAIYPHNPDGIWLF